MSTHSQVQHADGLYTLVLDDRATGNAIGTAMAKEIEGHLQLIERNRDAAALIITGAGNRFFSTGGNLKEYLTELTDSQLRAQFALMREICERLEALEVPTIAAINGKAVGGGVELALACDLRVMSSDAYLHLPQIRLGLITAWDGHLRLVRLVGESRALDLLATARIVPAQEAIMLGLVNRVGERAIDIARDIAGEIQRNDRGAMRVMKSLIRATRAACDGVQIDRARDEFWNFWPPKSPPVRGSSTS